MIQFSNSIINENDKDMHIFSIYSNSKEKLDSGILFLKEGLQNNEAVLLVTDEISKEEAIVKFKEIFKNDLQIDDYLKKGIITILTSNEWYFSNNEFDLERMIKKWKIAVSDVLSINTKDKNDVNIQNNNFKNNNSNKEINNNNNNNKIIFDTHFPVKIKRLRAFCDMKCFYERGFNDILINYESVGDRINPFPLYSLYAYESSFISNLNPQIFKTLVQHHEIVRENNHNVLINPSSKMHILLLYKNDNELDKAISTYINEGLKKGQICIYGTFLPLDDQTNKEFISSINNYKENVENGKLILIDLSSYYINAMIGNFEPFEQIIQEALDKIDKVNSNDLQINQKDKKDNSMRFAGICTTLLFKNKHFEECLNLEKWWHKKQFRGSTLCVYPKELLDQYPYDIYFSEIYHNHHIVVDSNGKLIPKYMD